MPGELGDDDEEEVEDVGESGSDDVAWGVPSALRSAMLVSARVLLSILSPGLKSDRTALSSPGSSTDTLPFISSGPDCW